MSSENENNETPESGDEVKRRAKRNSKPIPEHQDGTIRSFAAERRKKNQGKSKELKIKSEDREALLKHIADCGGIDNALNKLGIKRTRYENTIKDDPDYYKEIRSAKEAAEEKLIEGAIYVAHATSDFLPLIIRNDRVKAAELARRDRIAERKARMAEIEAMNGNINNQSVVNLSLLSAEELSSYYAILQKIQITSQIQSGAIGSEIIPDRGPSEGVQSGEMPKEPE